MVFSMKKLIILISIILFLSITTVAAGLFGPDTIECPKFSIEIPENYYKSPEWYDNDNTIFSDSLYLWGNEGNIERNLMMYEVSSFDDFNRSSTEEILETTEIDGISIDKCYDSEDSVFSDGKTIYGNNYTLAKFEKDGHYYIITNDFKGDSDDLDIKSDANLVKEIKNSLKIKN